MIAWRSSSLCVAHTHVCSDSSEFSRVLHEQRICNMTRSMRFFRLSKRKRIRGRRACVACRTRPAAFIFRGRVKADRHHTLCHQCYRSERDRWKANYLPKVPLNRSGKVGSHTSWRTKRIGATINPQRPVVLHTPGAVRDDVINE